MRLVALDVYLLRYPPRYLADHRTNSGLPAGPLQILFFRCCSSTRLRGTNFEKYKRVVVGGHKIPCESIMWRTLIKFKCVNKESFFISYMKLFSARIYLHLRCGSRLSYSL